MTHVGPARSALAAEVRVSRPAGGRLTPRDNLVRALTAHARAAVDPRLDGPTAAMQALYPDDQHSHSVVRATASPGTTTSSGWTALANLDAVTDLLGSLGPSSASAAIVRGALNVDLTGRGSLILPGMISGAGAVSFVQEASAIPVHAIDTSGGVTVTRFKLAGIATISRELARSTNAEVVIRSAIYESVGLAFDAALFSTTAADASRPAGILLGAVDASTGGDLIDDLAALAGSVAPVAGTTIILVAGPAAYSKIRLRIPNAPWPVYPSSALAGNMVVAVAGNALAFAADPRPEIDVNEEATVVMTDAPGSLIASDPTRSLWQTATVGIRLTMGVSWGLRVPAASAVATAIGSW